MEVPPEVLAWILACLEKKDLKQVRLVCRKLECAAAPLLFNEIYLSTNPAELEIAQKTARNFAASIKTVYFSTVEYLEPKWSQFKYASRENFRAPEYARLAHTNYGKLRQERQDMLRAGTYFGHLCFILCKIPVLESFILTDFESCSHPPHWERRRSRLWRLGDCPAHCSIQGCAYGNLKHLSHMVRPRSGLVHQSIESWSLVMMALAASGCKVREFDFLYRGHTPCGGFNNTMQQPFALQDIFQHFRQLRLAFYMNKDIVGNHIPHTLSAATKLTTLCIIADWSFFQDRRYGAGESSDFRKILGDCVLPRLTSLILTGFDSTEVELVGFLRGSSHLQHLNLTHHKLREDKQWESCANGIKDALPALKHIVLNALESGDGGDHAVPHHTHRYTRSEVEDFFHKGKTNPFICDHLKHGKVHVAFVTDLEDANRRRGVWAENKLWRASYSEYHCY